MCFTQIILFSLTTRGGMHYYYDPPLWMRKLRHWRIYVTYPRSKSLSQWQSWDPLLSRWTVEPQSKLLTALSCPLAPNSSQILFIFKMLRFYDFCNNVCLLRDTDNSTSCGIEQYNILKIHCDHKYTCARL